MGPRGAIRLVAAAAALVVSVSGCSADGDDTPAGRAVQQLAEAMTTPDAAALRGLVEDDTSIARTDLIVADVLADNALAGKRVEIAADVSRINGYGTFTTTSPEVPGLRLPVTNRLIETRTPGALETVDVRADREVSALMVGKQRVPVDPMVRAGKQVAFRLAPGEWSLGLPAS